jgi:HlyD family type I secretion membrane fusion protein
MMATIASDIESSAFFKETRRLILIGYLVLGVFISALLGWTILVPLSSAAIAPGVVSVEGYSKKIQHLEGGIIKEILIKDGDNVTAGQTLITLDKTQAQEEHDSIRTQLVLATTRHARFIAEKQDMTEIQFPDWILADVAVPVIANAIKKQTESLISRQKDHQHKLTIVGNRMDRLKNQLHQLQASLDAQKRRLILVREELKQNQQFLQQGLITRRDLFRLQNDEVDTEIEIKEKQSQIASIKQQISQLHLQKSDIISERNTKISEQLKNDHEQIVKLTHQLTKAKDILARKTILAPVSGTIVNLKKHTIGGVIKAGEDILEIVPTGQKLLIDAHVEPKDRDIILPGQNAEVRFTAFNQRILRPVKGIVKVISADKLTDPKTQMPYFLAKIELTEDPAKVLNNTPIYPGMQANVMIITGDRTAMEYIADPILRRFTKAFRED